jgi:hypothetical protein
MCWKTYKRKINRFTVEIETDELIKLVQGQYFYEEIKYLFDKQNVNSRSKLKLLCSFIDKDGILRVDGRLNNMLSIQADKRNRILLLSQSS